MNVTTEVIRQDDRLAWGEVERLLEREGIARDPHLDHTIGLRDTEGRLVATGSCWKNTLRCLAVASEHQGEGLMASAVSQLLRVQAERGNEKVFLCTKPENEALFSDLGFSAIVRLPELTFLENRPDGFENWLNEVRASLPERQPDAHIAAVVMHANPFTRGHRYLLDKASEENDLVLLFLLSEESGPIPYAVRKKLAEDGTADLSKVVLVPAGEYIISHATFPSYFLKSEEAVVRAHAELDAAVFGKIAAALGISRRYVGEEPFSRVTAAYNEILKRALPEGGVECRVVPRLCIGDEPVSASAVRQAIHDGELERVRDMLPKSTYRYFSSEEAEPVVRAIREEQDVRHY